MSQRLGTEENIQSRWKKNWQNAESFNHVQNWWKSNFFWKKKFFRILSILDILKAILVLNFFLWTTRKQFWKTGENLLAEGRIISLAQFPKMIMRNNCFIKPLVPKKFLSTRKSAFEKLAHERVEGGQKLFYQSRKKKSGNICIKTLILMFQRTFKVQVQQQCSKNFWRGRSFFL